MTEATVAAALSRPERLTPSERGRSNAWKRIGSRWVRVTYIDEGDSRVVITVTVRRRGPEEA